MHRRRVLRDAAAVAALGLAGCTASGTPPDTGGNTPTPTGTTTPETPKIVGYDFDVTAIDNAGDPTADVSFESESSQLVITGIIEGADGCKTATLGSVEYDRKNDVFRIDVVTTDRPTTGDEACTQALVYVEYELTVSFEGGIPSRAVVSHDGEELPNVVHVTDTPADGE